MHDANTLTAKLKTASLSDLLADAVAKVKAKPDDSALRQTLFRLYCVEGLWEKALMQLQTLALLDEAAQKQSELGKNLILSELMREEVLAGKRAPGLFTPDMPAWMTLLLQANKAQADNEPEQAETLRQQAFSQAPESAGGGEMTGKFEWIADGDGRIGPACEFISAGGYRQVPFSALQLLHVRRPADLLDLVWTPAHIKINGEFHYGYVPARYPLSADAQQNEKLGLRSEWQQISDTLAMGTGRKELITDSGEFSLLEVAEIHFRE
ncbi:type VI secretion system accessory protein TagJ [Erwinia sp. CGal63]|uniref:type VI secretion system accessory protein TagJ n=1 Tax=Erwinia sp. CGal63 TaxID=2919889 RepID=UPI003008AF1C